MSFRINKKIILRIMVFIMIYFSAETLLFGDTPYEANVLFGQNSNFIIILLALFAINGKTLKRANVVLFIVLQICLWMSCFINFTTESVNHYIFKSILLTGAFLIAMSYSFYDILDEVEIMIYFFSLCAIAFYILKIAVPMVVDMLPEIRGSNGGHYNTAFVSNMNRATYLDSGLYRIQGIFREPGVYAVYLWIALWHELFCCTRLRVKRIGMYFIIAILTFSTTAYVSIAVLVFSFILDKNTIQNKWIKRSIIAIGIFGIVYALLFTDLLSAEGIIFSKLFSENDTFVSGNARFASVYVNLYAFTQRPIWGYGIYHLNENFSNLAIQMTGMLTKDNTNSFLLLFAAHGIFFGGIILIGWLKLLWRQPRIKTAAVFLIISLLMVTSCEYLLNNLLLYLFSFIGFKQSEYRRGKNMNQMATSRL